MLWAEGIVYFRIDCAFLDNRVRSDAPLASRGVLNAEVREVGISSRRKDFQGNSGGMPPRSAVPRMTPISLLDKHCGLPNYPREYVQLSA